MGEAVGTVLALDMALNCGFARNGKRLGVPWLRTIPFESGPRPFIFREFRDFLIADIRRYGADAIVGESPLGLGVLRSVGRDGAHSLKTSENTLRILRGMIAIAEEVAGAMCDGNYHEYDAQRIKSYFTGDQHASKEAMLARANQLGWRPKDDNSADAGALWSLHMATKYPRWAPVATPLFQGVR